MLKIGLTGGIGSGKSTVARVFELLDVPVYYADEASKRLYSTDPALREEIIKHFGPEVYEGSEINRSRLAAEVFGDPERLALLNSIVHPPTLRDAAQWMSLQKAPYVIKEAALLFESGSAADLDYVIGVHASLSLRKQRVMARDKITEEQVVSRMERQMDESLKMQRCDFIIDNDEKELVLPQVLKLHQRFLEMEG